MFQGKKNRLEYEPDYNSKAIRKQHNEQNKNQKKENP